MYSELKVVHAVLKVIRHRKYGRKAEELLDAEKTVEDVLEALRTAGYSIVPTGVLNQLRKLISGIS